VAPWERARHANLHNVELFIVSVSGEGIVEEILAENDGVPLGDEQQHK
jgi:hypothetical protein